jgi:alpha-tubulin suppressor-like RCC1 family protein
MKGNTEMVCAKRMLNIVVMLVLTLTLKANADEVCLRAAMVSGGEYHTLVLMENGTVWACGGNANGQLGRGEIFPYSTILLQTIDGSMNTASGFLQDIIAIDAGWLHSLALDNINGHVWAWGGDTYGQIGNGSTAYDITSPIAVFSGEQNTGNPTAPLSNITCISAGRSGTHSLASQGQFTYAWGNNSSGQCGDGTFIQRDTPVKVKRSLSPVIYLGDGADADIVEVDAGVYHSLARDAAGYVWEWGSNNNSPLAHKVPSETGMGYLANIIEIASCYQSMALSSGGNVYQWQAGYPVKVPGGFNL